MKIRVTIFLFFITIIHVDAQPLSVVEDNRFKGLDTVFQQVLKTWHTAGFAIAVVGKDKVIYAKGFGYRDFAAKQPVTPNTIFAIGSCSKAFTSAMVGILQKDGKLDIDKPVSNYLPSLKFYNDELTNNVTLRDMMSHRTGLPRFDMSWYFFNTASIDSMLQRVRYMEPTAGIREKWQYNNFMFVGQGGVIEKLTGRSWGDNIKDSLFMLLDMDHSSVAVAEMKQYKDVSKGYTLRANNTIKMVPYYNVGGIAPAGAINSTVNDMAKWVIAWLNGGKYKGKQVIPADFRNEAISSQAIIDGSLPDPKSPGTCFSNYGFGWFIDSYKGHYRVEHGGNIDGFSANASFFPADSIGIIVLSNQSESKLPNIVRNILVDRILNLRYENWNIETKTAYDKAIQDWDEQVKENAVEITHNAPTHPLKDFVGNYSNPAYGTMRLFVEKDSLFAKTVTHTLWLMHTNNDTFDIYDKDPEEGIDISKQYGISLQFHMNKEKRIDGFESKLEESLKPFFFVKDN